jgi:sterol desaturase/sphingolipid hydroxylase (fatty acid hydroxylase superfamily)
MDGLWMILNIGSYLFGAPKIEYDDISRLEQNSPELILYAVPAVILFTIIEIAYSHYSGKKIYDSKETAGSLMTGIGNVLISLALKTTLIYGDVLLYNLVPWRMSLNWWTLIPCILIYDFCSYWSHRISHFNRFFWATHVVHHSGEHYNLTVSFRQSWIQHFKIIFFLPVALIGFHPVIFFITHQVGVLMQFWQHTSCIGKLHPVIEFFLVTPSSHRVHHGTNEKYLDKNFGVIFIFWDRLLRTYQQEEETPQYGLTTKIDHSLNPLYLNFHELKDIYRDVKKAKGFRKKMFYLFGKPVKVAEEKSS